MKRSPVRSAGKPWCRQAQGAIIGTIVRIVCPASIWTTSPEMEPIAVWVRKNGEWAIIHRCRVCGALSSNRIAADDNPMKLMSLAMKPISSPPFPLERIEEMTRLMGGDGELKW